MRYLTSIIFLLLTPFSIAFAIEAGEIAPDFILPTIDNSQIKLSELKGHYVYVDFWASWCVPCRASFPWMNKISKDYPSLKIVAVNLDKKRKDVDSFLSKFPPEFTVALDPEGRSPLEYKPRGMPTSYLIDPTGKIQSIHVGFKESIKAELEAEISRSIGGSK